MTVSSKKPLDIYRNCNFVKPDPIAIFGVRLYRITVPVDIYASFMRNCHSVKPDPNEALPSITEIKPIDAVATS